MTKTTEFGELCKKRDRLYAIYSDQMGLSISLGVFSLGLAMLESQNTRLAVYIALFILTRAIFYGVRAAYAEIKRDEFIIRNCGLNSSSHVRR